MQEIFYFILFIFWWGKLETYVVSSHAQKEEMYVVSLPVIAKEGGLWLGSKLSNFDGSWELQNQAFLDLACLTLTPLTCLRNSLSFMGKETRDYNNLVKKDIKLS